MALDTAIARTKLRGLTAAFSAELKATTPFYPRLCMTIPSAGYDEEYGMLGSVPGVREWLADRKFHSLRAADFTIVNKEWESSVSVPKTAIDDDRQGMYAPTMRNMAKRAKRHPDKLLLSDLVVNGTSQACFDGQFFFDTDHAWGDSGTQSNDLAETVVAAATPTLAEFQAKLSTMIQTMLAYKDDFGEFIHDDAVVDLDSGMSLLLLVPLHYLEVARKAVTAGIAVGGGDTNVPPISADVVATPHITGNYFDLYRTDTPIKPYVFQARTPLELQSKGLDDIEFKDVKYMTYARYNVGYGAWWNAIRMTLTDA